MSSPLIRIRKAVLAVSQAALAEIAGVSQGTVSKWEAGELEPDRGQLERIRSEVLKRGLEWDDRWFFEPAEGRDDIHNPTGRMAG